MNISDLAARLRQGEKLCISFDGWMDDGGHQKWTSPLSDAQIFAYWNHKVEHMREYEGTLYCIIKAEVVR